MVDNVLSDIFFFPHHSHCNKEDNNNFNIKPRLFFLDFHLGIFL